MATQRIPIYIPVYISSATYAPARVLPRILFFNGMVGCESFYIADENNGGRQQDAFPYFDNYNVVSGSFPTTDSKSLLFTNETAVYGQTPTRSLYTEYWEKYIQLLYNPRTRLLNCSAIIPLADYFDMQLNDVVNFRGNYYHLRAINEYSLKDGTCTLQLLGPIIADTFSQEVGPAPTPPAPPTAFATASIYLSEFTSASVFIDANLIVSGTAYYFAGNFTQSISGGAVANVVMEGKDGGSTTWGAYTTASATLSILNNGTPITSSTQYIYSGSGDTVITFPTTFTAGNTITISGSSALVGSPTPPPPPTGSATLDWSFSEINGANGEMIIYVNSVAVETATSTAAGTRSVYPGDTIYVELEIFTTCGSPNTYANVYTSGNIINDAACANGTPTALTTGTYTVVSGDIGSYLVLDTYAQCDSGCL
jgi:hypothetical protein